jgi:hypothetical protein
MMKKYFKNGCEFTVQKRFFHFQVHFQNSCLIPTYGLIIGGENRKVEVKKLEEGVNILSPPPADS